MSKHRHHMHKKRGGSAGSMKGRDDYAGSGEPNVVKEASEKKFGGGVAHKMHGGKIKSRIGKKRGGGVGSDKHPFSSAYTASTEAT